MVGILIAAFVVGYLAIIFEHNIKINKAAPALITGVVCWTIFILFAASREHVVEALLHHLGELSQILFFLMGAMAIVELIDLHDGFDIITRRINTKSKRKLIWIIGLLTFFLSPVLDNLTTAIVMISLVRKLIAEKNDRLLFAGVIVIAANAGGAWSPIGDVTTTMLWIGGQVTASNIIVKLILPSLVCVLVPLVVLHFSLKGDVQTPEQMIDKNQAQTSTPLQRNVVFLSGVGVLLMVPVFKGVTHLPPFMGILIGLGILWVITEVMHGNRNEEERKQFSVAYALQKTDVPSILFFLGILLAVGALQETGQLALAATALNTHLKNETLIVISIGLLSAIVDNVPLVAAAMGMYTLEQFPTDHSFWEFLAYCTGTGGSVLIIGSAAGVAIMGIEKVEFVWYLKRIGWLALLGYLAGACVYILQQAFF